MSNPLKQIPELVLVETPEQILEEMVVDYEAAYFEATGESVTLPRASPEYIFLSTQAARFYQAYADFDDKAKQNLLTYARGTWLDNLGALVGAPRLQATAAVSKVEFSLSEPQPQAIHIPLGTRVSSSSKVFFSTLEDLYIEPGRISAGVTVRCVEAGTAGNGFQPGQLSTLVDPIPFVAGVSNLEPSQGGANVEDDENYRLRIYYKPDSFSVAGPEEAYRYFVKAFSQAIGDVVVTSPAPGVVKIVLVLQGGELPTPTFLYEVGEYLEGKRPDTDQVEICGPEIRHYTLEAVYYIDRSQRRLQAEIMSKVQTAVEEYVAWQDSAIGRDLNPDELVAKVRQAGAKRMEIVSPVFESVEADCICQAEAVSVTFGGLEDD